MHAPARYYEIWAEDFAVWEFCSLKLVAFAELCGKRSPKAFKDFQGPLKGLQRMVRDFEGLEKPLKTFDGLRRLPKTLEGGLRQFWRFRRRPGERLDSPKTLE
jgi:hypothetical protein